MDKHIGIFNGQVKKKRYKIFTYWGDNDPKAYGTWEIEYKKISECEFDRPPLNSGDKIHLHELNNIVEVNDAIRSTSGAFIYNTNYVIEEIEDDETPKSKQEVEKKINEIIERIKKDTESESSKKKWYQFWK